MLCIGGLATALLLLSPAASGAENPKRGGTIVYAVSAGPRSLDPQLSTSTIDIELASELYETLVALGEDFTPRPSLASHIDVSPDARRYSFTLRHGVRFHNGKIMTSADVLASFKRYQRVSPNAEALSNVETFETPAPDMFIVAMKDPAPVFLDVMMSPGFPIAIMPAEEAEKTGDMAIIGTGPFQLAEWRRDDHILLRRFDGYSVNEAASGIDGYAGKKIVYVDAVRYNILPEPNARIAALQAGGADVTSQVPFSLSKRIDGKNGFALQTIFPGCMQSFFLNTQIAPTNNIAVRQAIQAAMGVDEILDAVGQVSKRNPQLSYPGSKFYAPGTPDFHYDMNNQAAAKSLLQQAGYHGEPIVLQVTPSYSWQMNAALVLAEQLKAVGMTITLKTVDIVTANTNRQRGTGGWNVDSSLYCSQPLLGPPQWRQYLTVYPQMKDAALSAMYSRYLNSLSASDRAQAWTDVQHRLFDQAYWIKLGDFANINGYRTQLHGLIGWYNLRFWGVWKDG
jgi:peptide/nickel transport system substrate-binding protein